MAIRKSSNTGIPFGNTAGRPSSPGTGQPYFNGELQRLELYTGATYGWQNVVAETPGVTGYTGTVLETNTTNTITITGTNFASGATASLVGNDGTEYLANTTTVSNLTSITATFGAIPANKEPYDIKVTNPSNLYGVYYDILTVNDKPLWSSAAGSLGTFADGVSINIPALATDEEGNTLTFAITSGSLPSGLSLNTSTGTITGTSPTLQSTTTYNFTISASDGVNTVQTRAFSITINQPIVSGGTLSSDSTYYYRTFTANGNLTTTQSITADILIAGGGGGGGRSLTGGGGGGSVGHFTSVTIPSGTNAITIGAGGTDGGSSANGGSKGESSTFLTMTLLGGGGAPGRDNNSSPAWGQSNHPQGGANGPGSSSDGPTAQIVRNGISQSVPVGITGTIYGGFSGGAGGGTGTNYPGGGGAGANQNGTKPSSNSATGGAGGEGKQINFGIHNHYWGGGGGGSAYTGGAGGGAGGLGGGGGGAANSGSGGAGGGSSLNSGSTAGSGGGNPSSSTPGGNGGANTGGGGGGGAHGDGPGGTGGSGIVIVRYTRASVGG